MNLLDIIRSSVYSGLKKKFLNGNFHKIVSEPLADLDDETGDPISLSITEYTFEGFIEEYTEKARAYAGIPETIYQVCILAPSLSVEPGRDDEVFLDGKWSRLVNAKTDPAKAMWVCQAFQIEEPTVGS